MRHPSLAVLLATLAAPALPAPPSLPPPPPKETKPGRPSGLPPPPPEPFETALPRKPPKERSGSVSPTGVVVINQDGAVGQGMEAVREHVKAGRMSAAAEELERIRSAVHEDPAEVRVLAEAEGLLAADLLKAGSQAESERIA